MMDNNYEQLRKDKETLIIDLRNKVCTINQEKTKRQDTRLKFLGITWLSEKGKYQARSLIK